MSEEIYHRVATGSESQDLHTALDQVSTKEIWGKVSMYGSRFPTVRAMRGPLPEGKDGIQFCTSVPPTRGSSTPREVYWKLHEQSPQVLGSEDGEFARIKARILLVRYSDQKNLLPRCDWRP
ncbi:hypothetical protein [Achromobacter dolens]|jgi:hypothetical protein|uniref:hypothetical protein n=1 Tax=Achromobacter dolens TaxID=1287738 RepID=UPI00355613CD